jgi:hypothetical protein
LALVLPFLIKIGPNVAADFSGHPPPFLAGLFLFMKPNNRQLSTLEQMEIPEPVLRIPVSYEHNHNPLAKVGAKSLFR